MSSCPKVVVRPDEVAARLAEIGGLTHDVLVEAALLGEQARRNCTMNHPVTAPGMMAYFERVRALRDQLLLRGWTAKCAGGSELTISPDGQHAVVVASGDENTGSLSLDPKTKCAKGIRMEEAADRNEAQLTLFAALGLQEARAVLALKDENPACFTWIFLVGSEDDKLTLELSLPVGLGEDGRAEAWSERVILTSIPLDGGTRLGVSPFGPEPGPEFDVSVTRRTA